MGTARRRAWILAALLVPAAALLTASRGRGEAYSVFPHRPHLRAALVLALEARAKGGPLPPGPGGVADRDCRSCHDYETGAGPEPHLATGDRERGCLKCHLDPGNLVVRAGLPPAAPGRRPFPHREHLRDRELTCFSCHLPVRGGDWTGLSLEFTVPPPTLGRPAGAAPGAAAAEDPGCARCHAEHRFSGGRVRQVEAAGGQKRCQECHQGTDRVQPLAHRAAPVPADPGARPFLHRDHGGPSADCRRCHEKVLDSNTAWDYDPAVASARCQACHVADAAGTPLVRPGRPDRLDPKWFQAFSHRVHLAAKGGMDCVHCHYPERQDSSRYLDPGREGAPEPLGRGALLAYARCVQCHEHEKQAVERHGVGAWACFRCHAPPGEKDATAAGLRAPLPMRTATVTREGIGTIGFAAHRHPGVTTSGRALADPGQPGGKSCADCHRGKPEAMASRLAARPFRHEPHLGAAPGSGDCLVCHPSASTSSRSATLRRFDPLLDAGPPGGAAGARGCLDCHVGATAADLGIVPREGIRVPEFDHAAHVAGARRDAGAAAKAPRLECLQCHAKGGDAGYETPADVKDCRRCHSHAVDAPEKLARTGESRPEGDAARCAACHREGVDRRLGWIPDPPADPVVRPHLQLGRGKQFHDRGGGCAACHERDALETPPGGWRYAPRVEEARVARSVHRDERHADLERISRKAAGNPAEKERTCTACHADVPPKDPGGILR